MRGVRRVLPPLLDVLLLYLADFGDGGRIPVVPAAEVQVVRALGDDEGDDGLGHAAEDAARRPGVQQAVANKS